MSQPDALALAEAAVDRLVEAHDLDTTVYVGVARWTGRHGVCKYNKRLPDDKRRFGERMPSIPTEIGSHAIVINERILEKGNRADFIDTVQHELAHAVCFDRHERYPYDKSMHGTAWKEIARELGADPSSSHHKRDRSDEFEYYIGCPNPDCDMESGKTKRSKTIKQPFSRRCQRCGESGLVSYDAGEEPPEENGVVAVESLPWDNKSEWIEEGRP